MEPNPLKSRAYIKSISMSRSMGPVQTAARDAPCRLRDACMRNGFARCAEWKRVVAGLCGGGWCPAVQRPSFKGCYAHLGMAGKKAGGGESMGHTFVLNLSWTMGTIEQRQVSSCCRGSCSVCAAGSFVAAGGSNASRSVQRRAAEVDVQGRAGAAGV